MMGASALVRIDDDLRCEINDSFDTYIGGVVRLEVCPQYRLEDGWMPTRT